METREDLADFNAILILSGDGLVFEVFSSDDELAFEFTSKHVAAFVTVSI